MKNSINVGKFCFFLTLNPCTKKEQICDMNKTENVNDEEAYTCLTSWTGLLQTGCLPGACTKLKYVVHTTFSAGLTTEDCLSPEDMDQVKKSILGHLLMLEVLLTASYELYPPFFLDFIQLWWWSTL